MEEIQVPTIGAILTILTVTGSIIGAFLNFFIAVKRRRTEDALARADAQKTQGESYALLVENLSERIDSISSELKDEIDKRKTFQGELETERTLRLKIEEQLREEQELREKCAEIMAELQLYAEELEKRLATLERNGDNGT